MAVPFASPSDIEAVWGELSVEEEARVEAWLITASNNLRLIGRRRGLNIDLYIACDELLETAAKDAVVEAVRRRLINPSGIRQRSTTTTDGPFSDTRMETIDSAISAGSLYFTPEELSWLPAGKKTLLRSFTLRSGFRQ